MSKVIPFLLALEAELDIKWRGNQCAYPFLREKLVDCEEPCGPPEVDPGEILVAWSNLRADAERDPTNNRYWRRAFILLLSDIEAMIAGSKIQPDGVLCPRSIHVGEATVGLAEMIRNRQEAEKWDQQQDEWGDSEIEDGLPLQSNAAA